MTTTTTAPRFFVAVPTREGAHGIFGIGRTPDQALDEAWAGTNQGADRPTNSGFEALPATERLVIYVERHSPDAGFRPVTNDDGLQDLDVDGDLLAGIVAEVDQGFDGCTTQHEWKAEDALTDASAYVDAYVADDESVDEELREALEDPQMRVAADVAVRDLILETISELAA